MSKKLKGLAGVLAENELALRIKDSTQQVWLAGLGAYGVAQKEGSKVLNALKKEGEIVQARALQITDEKIAVVASKASDTFDRLEHAFDDGVARTLDRFGVLTKRDINMLSKSVRELTVIVEDLAERKAAPSSSGKSVALTP